MKKYNGKLVYCTQNENGSIEVVDTPILRNLHFGTSVMQSSMFHDDPYALEMEYNQVMMLSLLYHPHPQRVLFLGLGGASKPKFIWKYFPTAICEVIEINPAVIDVAERFFEIPHDPRFIIHQIDAAQFVKNAPAASYDLIFIDLYVASGIAQAVASPSFFKDCRTLLRTEGMAIWNIWSVISPTLIEASKQAFIHQKTIPIQESPNLVVLAWDTPTLISTTPEALQAITGLDFPKLASRLRD